jgi:Terminase small subunit
MGRKSEKVVDGTAKQALFKEHYLRTGNAYESAKLAGYRESVAKSRSFEMARAVRITIAEALRARGLDEVSQAQKLARLQNARAVKWNPKKEKFVGFEDADVQMRATQEINRLLDAYPAPKETSDNRPVQIIFPGSFANLTVKAESRSEERGHQ